MIFLPLPILKIFISLSSTQPTNSINQNWVSWKLRVSFLFWVLTWSRSPASIISGFGSEFGVPRSEFCAPRLGFWVRGSELLVLSYPSRSEANSSLLTPSFLVLYLSAADVVSGFDIISPFSIRRKIFRVVNPIKIFYFLIIIKYFPRFYSEDFLPGYRSD